MFRQFCIIASLLMTLLLTLACPVLAAPAGNNLLIYCGITMVRPMTDIARQFENRKRSA